MQVHFAGMYYILRNVWSSNVWHVQNIAQKKLYNTLLVFFFEYYLA